MVSQRDQGGWTVAEAIAALAIISIGLTASFAVLIDVRGGQRLTAEAALRSRLTEDVMERTLVRSFERIETASFPIPANETGGRPGWRAEVRVRPVSPGLKAVEVAVIGGGRTSELHTLTAVSRSGP